MTRQRTVAYDLRHPRRTVTPIHALLRRRSAKKLNRRRIAVSMFEGLAEPRARTTTFSIDGCSLSHRRDHTPHRNNWSTCLLLRRLVSRGPVEPKILRFAQDCDN